MSEPLLAVRHLGCERGGRVLFSDLHFELSAGSLLRIAGGNGSGKSTLLRVLTGLSTDFSGELFWRGQPLAEVLDDYRLAMCYLAHDKAVKPMLTVNENIDWFLALYPARDDAGLEEALKLFSLLPFRHQPCGQLSAGQQQRVALARLWLSAASLWILDEPFTAIDRQGIAGLEQVIGDFVRRGGSVVLTTHHDLQLPGQTLELGQ